MWVLGYLMHRLVAHYAKVSDAGESACTLGAACKLPLLLQAYQGGCRLLYAWQDGGL